MNNTTRCYPRTLRAAFGMSAEDAVAIHVYRTPLAKRVFLGIIKWGWIIAPAVLAITVLSGCADDAETAALVAQDLQDAVAQAKGAK